MSYQDVGKKLLSLGQPFSGLVSNYFCFSARTKGHVKAGKGQGTDELSPPNRRQIEWMLHYDLRGNPNTLFWHFREIFCQKRKS